MALKQYPALAALAEDLSRLEATEGVRERLREGREKKVSMGLGRDVAPVRVPWVRDEEWMLSDQQRRVVRVLVEALDSKVTDVDERALKQEARWAGKLRDLFEGTGAWGVLIVPGKRKGCYMLAPPPDGWGVEEDVRTVEDDE